MRLTPFARFIVLATLIVCAGACSELYVEQQFRFISIGMTDERMAKLFGPPWSETLKFRSGQYTSLITFDHGQVETIDYLEGDIAKYTVSFIHGVVKHIWGDEASSPYASSPVRLGMTHAEVDSIMKAETPMEDCRTYVGDARAEYYVCFKNHKVISKELKDVPP